MIELRHNLFRFATSEISHSALWAWILQAWDSTDEFHAAPKRLASAFLSRIAKKGLDGGTILVEPEKTHSRGRYDIRIVINDSFTCIIENKIKAIPDEEQLNRYMDKSVHRYVLLQADYHYDYKLPKEWLYIGLSDIIELIEQTDCACHPMLRDYESWLKHKQAGISEIISKAHSDDGVDVVNALASPIGQWEFMKRIMIGISNLTDQYRGLNNDGTPWTQNCFWGWDWTDSEKKESPDYLFYRIDKDKRGYYVSMKQYCHIREYRKHIASEVTDEMFSNKKLKRLNQMRELWNLAIERVNQRHSGLALLFQAPRDRAVYESDVMTLMVGQGVNTVENIKRLLPLYHKAFVKQLNLEF